MLKRAGLLVAIVAGLVLPAVSGWSQTVTPTQAEGARATKALNIIFSAGGARIADRTNRISGSGLAVQSKEVASLMNNASPGERAAIVEALARQAATDPALAVVLANVMKDNPSLAPSVAQGLALAGNAVVVAQVQAVAQSIGATSALSSMNATLQSVNPTLATNAALAANNPLVVASIAAAVAASATTSNAQANNAVTTTFVNPVNTTQTAQNGTPS